MCRRFFLVFISLILSTPSWAKGVSSDGTGKGFNLYSVKGDIELGEQVEEAQLAEFRKKKIPVDSPEKKEIRDRLDGIMKKIIAVSDMPHLPYRLHYVESPVVNAMCAPGGKVFVYQGLSDPQKGLVKEESDAEFAAVLGHEYAHATMRHVTRQVSRYQGFNILGSLAGAFIGAGVGSGASRAFGEIYSLGGMFYFPKYSRKYETEADLVGAKYMAKAGYDPRVAVSLWQRAADRRKKEGKSEKTSIFMSHPGNGDRAKRLEQELPKILPYYEKGSPQ